MINLKKEKIDSGYKIIINTEQGEFLIIFAGNLDLYFGCRTTMLVDDEEKSFLITKENYPLYLIFEELFDNVKNCKIFDSDTTNNELKEKERSNTHKLFHDNKIEWYSDDGEYEKVSRMVIEKEEDSYKFTFVRSKDNIKFLTYFVCVCNSGSRYGYFNIPFMNLYHKLLEHNFDCQQIHIEEYIYNQKKLCKTLS